MSKNWSPKDFCDTKHLLAAAEKARIAKNLAAGTLPRYEPGWTSETVVESFEGDDKSPAVHSTRIKWRLNPYRFAVDEFETPDDRSPQRERFNAEIALSNIEVPREYRVEFVATARRVAQASLAPQAKDYSDASEGTGRVSVCGSNYDSEEAEFFTPRDTYLNHGEIDRKSAGADDEATLGLDTESDLVGSMADAVKAWAGTITPPPKAADPTVEALVLAYLANGGEVHTFEAYRTTPEAKIKFKSSFHPEWAGGTGIPPELRSRKKLFRVKPKTGPKQWSNTA